MVDRLMEICSRCVDRERKCPTGSMLEMKFSTYDAVEVIGFHDHPKLGAMVTVRHSLAHISDSRSGSLDTPLGRTLMVQWVPEDGTDPGPLWRYVGTYFRTDGDSLKHDPLHVYVHGEVE